MKVFCSYNGGKVFMGILKVKIFGDDMLIILLIEKIERLYLEFFLFKKCYLGYLLFRGLR